MWNPPPSSKPRASCILLTLLILQKAIGVGWSVVVTYRRWEKINEEFPGGEMFSMELSKKVVG